jgi:hypothetical protein
MEVLTRIRAGGRQLDCGLATTETERAAILAQRFRIYQRCGYYRIGLTADHDEYDEQAIHLLAVLRRAGADVMLGSARFIPGRDELGFRFPIQRAFELHWPDALAAFPAQRCGEISRVVSERIEGSGLGGLLTPLGLIQAVSEYSQRHDIRSGVAFIKRRFVRALASLGVHLQELAVARVRYPVDGPAAPYFYRHPEPVVPVYWLVEETAPAIERAIARSVESQRPAPSRPGESTRNDKATAR